jgi:hypothetical protein
MTHSLSQWLSRSLQFAVLLSLACSGAAVAQIRHYVAPERELSSPSHRLQTPADLQLIPYLKAHTAHASASTKLNSLLKSQGTGYVTSPAFGGYVNAPMYDARTTASLATGSTNNGVSVELGADYDKDGKPDIAVLQQDGTLNILMNNGKGVLSAPVSYLNPNYLTSIVNNAYAVDVNGDGYTDIVAFDYNNNTTITWMNLGNGTFNAAVTTALDTTYGYPNMVYLADVNGDGKADLLFGMIKLAGRTSATVYLETQLGKGDGTFATPSSTQVQSFTYAASGYMPSNAGIAVADINGDGKMDVALAVDERFSSSSGKYVVTVALGNNDGTFNSLGTVQPIAVSAASSGISPSVSYNTSILTFADVDGDGKLDLVGDINGVLEVAIGKGNGSFDAPVTSDLSAISLLSHSVLLDVNGDGKPDLVGAGATMGVFLGKGDGTFAAPVAGSQYIFDPAGYQSLFAADFDGDGVKDIAQLGDDYKQVSLFFGNGKGGFRGAPLVTANDDQNGLSSELVTSGKYTSSGFSNPIFNYNGSTTSQLVTGVGDGKGNFTSVQALASYPSDLQYIEPIHADFNGDGLEDLVYANTTGDVYVALSKGNGSFGTPVAVGLPAAACPVYYGAAGDLNGDGKIDLVIPYGGDAACGSSNGGATGYYVALGNGDGTFATATFTSTGTELYSVQLADLNGDGKLDLVIDDVPLAYGSGYQVSTAKGNGDGTFGDPSVILTNYIVSNISIADINNDGKADLVLSSEEVENTSVSTGSILLITGNGDGTFNVPNQIGTGNFFYGLQVADMNNDGNADIVATLYSTVAQPVNYYGMVTLLGYGNGQFAEPFNQLESLSSTIPQVGNFVNDNAPDVMTETGYGAALFIGQGSTSLALTTSASSITFGTEETLTATLASSMTGRPAVTGTVSFYDGSTLLGTAMLSSGQSTFTTNSLSPGTHTVRAVYSGDTNFNPNTSSNLSITVAAVAPGFTVTSSVSSLTITGGSQGLVTLNLAANASFSGTVTLTCAGLPANATCAVNPDSIVLSAGSTKEATLVIGTTGTHAQLHHSGTPWEAAAASLATLFGFFFFGRKRVRLFVTLSAVLILSVAGLLAGCNGGGNNPKTSAPTTAAGTYNVTVTAKPASGSNVSTQTTTVAITVD